MTGRPEQSVTAKTDLVLHTRTSSRGLQASFIYYVGAFDESSIDHLADRFQQIVSIFGHADPQTGVGEILELTKEK